MHHTLFPHLSGVRDGHVCLFLQPIVLRSSLLVFLFLFSSHTFNHLLFNLLRSEVKSIERELVFTTDEESGARKRSTQRVTLANAFQKRGTRRQLTKVMTRTFRRLATHEKGKSMCRKGRKVQYLREKTDLFEKVKSYSPLLIMAKTQGSSHFGPNLSSLTSLIEIFLTLISIGYYPSWSVKRDFHKPVKIWVL